MKSAKGLGILINQRSCQSGALHFPTFAFPSSPLFNTLRSTYFIMAGLSLRSTYKLVSGYEIPVVGFGVSYYPRV